jgi:hypothetical protein
VNSKVRAGLIGGVIVSVAAAAMVLALNMRSHPRAVASLSPSVAAPGNSIVIGDVPNAHRGQELEVASAGYAPLADIDIALDGSAWHETARADRFGRVIFAFLVPLEIVIGHYILAITGRGSTTAPPPSSSPAGSMPISVTIPKVTLFQFTVR